MMFITEKVMLIKIKNIICNMHNSVSGSKVCLLSALNIHFCFSFKLIGEY